MDRKTFLIAGVAFAILIAVLAPFIASSSPDGLEGAFYSIFGAKEGDAIDQEKAVLAEETAVERTGNDFSWESPFQDYSIHGLDTSGEILAIVLGTILVLLIGFGLSKFVVRPKT